MYVQCLLKKNKKTQEQQTFSGETMHNQQLEDKYYGLIYGCGLS